MARIRVETEGAEEMKQISVMLRGILGLKQHELAQLLSTTKTTVSTWETRGIVPFPARLPRLPTWYRSSLS